MSTEFIERPRAVCRCGFLINPDVCKCTHAREDHPIAGLPAHEFAPLGCECAHGFGRSNDKLDEMRGSINKALRKKPVKRRKRVEREEEPEGKLVAHVESLDGLCEKFVSPGRRDVPDRLVIEGHGLDRAAHLLRDILKANGISVHTHAGRKDIVRQLIAQVIYFVECKAKGKKPSKRQKRDHDKRRARGLTVLVYDGEWRHE